MSICLLYLNPALDHSDELVIALEWFRRDEAAGRYEAVSYAWGTDTKTESVTMRQYSRWFSTENAWDAPEEWERERVRAERGVKESIAQDGNVVDWEKTNAGRENDCDESNSDLDPDHYTRQVRTTVTTMLRHLRQKYTTRVLWVDAICINQDDAAQKSDQVSNMGTTYHNARRTLVWLGPDRRPIDDVRSSRSYFHDLFYQEERAPESSELIVPSNSLIKNWSKVDEFLSNTWFQRRWVIQEVGLSKNITMIMGRDQMCFDCIFESIQYAPVAALQMSSTARSAFQILMTMSRIRAQRVEDFLKLLIEVDSALCADDRDRLYALNNLRREPMLVDYSTSTNEVYRRFVLSIAFLNPHILACAGAYQAKTMPSWVPNWSVPHTTKPLFYHYRPSYKVRNDVIGILAINFGVLTIRASSLGHIACKGPRWEQSPPKFDVEAFYDVTEFFTHNREPHGSESFHAQLDSIVHVLTVGLIYSARSLRYHLESSASNQSNSITADLDETLLLLLHTIYVIMTGRRCFATKKFDWAIGPEDLEEGDCIFAVPGCWYPIVLRKVSDATNSDSGSSKWMLIGECYVLPSPAVQRMIYSGPMDYYDIQ